MERGAEAAADEALLRQQEVANLRAEAIPEPVRGSALLLEGR